MTWITRRELLASSAALAGSAALPNIAHAAYPERPITVAMMAPPGGATDRGTRPVIELMKKAMNARAVALQNMSGAGGIQAMDYVRSRPTDGYSWLGANDVIESFPSLGKIDYDWREFDFWMSGGTACGVCVPASSKIETFKQWIEEVGSNPGKYSIATTPSGSLWSNVAVFLRKKVGLDFKIANYKGGGPSVRAVIAQETNFGCMGVTPQVNFMNAGKLRCLAATVPDDWKTAGTTIPTMLHEIKDPLFSKTMPWTNIHGVALKKGAPADVLAAVDKAFATAMADKSMEKVYNDNAFFPFRAGREEANKLMGERTALQAYVVEVILGTAKKTRDELKINKIEG
ncbi:MAG: Bug family tripartite tricarboxylate transporter substrate binding protein [Hyphomicrobiaceae bacterium]